MKQPLWIVNSALLLVLIFVLFFILFSRVTVPYRESIEFEGDIATRTVEAPTINIAKIYEHDLFDTYQSTELTEGTSDVARLIAMPRPPMPKPVEVPAVPRPTFLNPLGVTLKAIVTTSYDESKSRIVVMDNKTNQEAVYKVGDTIDDAQLIRIFSNKAVFVRSNGQQEVLYTRERDAVSDPIYSSQGGWSEVVQEVKENEFVIISDLFTERIKNLAQFIDMLDLTTAYQKGKSVGCRIGLIERDSFGTALGLRTGDIVVSINGIPADTRANRVKIYKGIVAMDTGTYITIELVRGGQAQFLRIVLEPLKKPFNIENKSSDTGVVRVITSESLKEKNMESMRERFKFAPTAKELRERERRSMVYLSKRVKPSILE
jgi:type II secretory pathway component PulC